MGMKMPIDRKHNIRPETGLFERAVASHFRQLTNDARIGYDIGAELGYYTLAMCRRGFTQVVAFEPDAVRSALLQRTREANRIDAQRMVIVDCAVADTADSGCCRIDDLIAEGSIPPPDFVKMDIDGGELLALHGMQATILRSQPSFIVEVHSLYLEREVAEFLRERNYRVQVVDSGPILRALLPEKRTAPGIHHNRWLVAERVRDFT